MYIIHSERDQQIGRNSRWLYIFCNISLQK